MVYILTVSKGILVGTISNAEKQFERDFERVYASLHFFEEIDVFIVESDSSDSTVGVLNRISKKTPNFNFVSLGNLKVAIPNRIERIRKCRNVYVEYVRNNIDFKEWDYVVVADLDGMNSMLKDNSILKIFPSQTSWDACFANQKHGYYDIYALREKSWMPNNCFEELELIRSGISKDSLPKHQLLKRVKRLIEYDNARKITIYDQMRVIPKKTDWISVDSAFGGLGIYKSKWFLKYDYSKILNGETQYSEHIDFHLKCREEDANFFIVPTMINSNWNEYNINRFFIVRQLRQYIANHKNVRAFIFSLFRRN
jgi:hypothetical protein